MKLVLATNNLHKIREFKEMFTPYRAIELLSLRQFPDYNPPEETGKTFLENASLKALHAASALNHLVLADDSGLVVPALKGYPGIYSRRYAGSEASDHDNRQKLLRELASIPNSDRSAYYQCALVLASPDGLKKSVEAFCEGFIIESPKGSNGFGYDPVFVKNENNKSFAELDERTKNRISHRRKAFEKLIIYLESISE